ncbi:hypothetical protein AGOR_G00162700 [Albula goreensis]|uniref:c-SKI SMAD4-binding domain-containing protein n=1 Tax=Albula goreensis TaxID=1534307 RepID=A0A8T3CZ37_9TELE|nr:hypothetical protein AGOR_G00162700 [Albula goreensis]
METIAGTLASGRDSSSSPNSTHDAPQCGSASSLKPNQVSETVLYGVPIVSLVIDGLERLCLAQISNTLLKSYSYNEIHNRRVALGITCVQCTPVQLEVLRRAGAMPVSSRRCGMITKREAERLCKSFLGAHNPPKLPENFAFDVSHECAWGCRGSFIPTRYNSSRAKCIKCTYCNMYFSPNKFIFHSHRTPESKYTQPDAANFNSWRRHLKLTDRSSTDDVAHAWEDVKAMFNGGSRKRTLPMGGTDRSPSLRQQGSGGLPQQRSPEVPLKTLRSQEDRGTLSLTNSVRSYPIIPVPSKTFGMIQKLPPPLFPHPYGFPAFGLCQKKDDNLALGEHGKASVSGVFWPVTKDCVYPSLPVFWPSSGGLPMSPYPHSQAKLSVQLMNTRQNERHVVEQSARQSTPQDVQMDSDRGSSSLSARNEEDKAWDETRSLDEGHSNPRKLNYVSAFRPVVKDTDSIAKLYGNREAYKGALSPGVPSDGSSCRSVSPGVDSEEETDVDVESDRMREDELQLSAGDSQHPRAPTPSQKDETNLLAAAEKPQESLDKDAPNEQTSKSKNVNLAPEHEVHIHERNEHALLNAQSTLRPTTTSYCSPKGHGDPHKEESPSSAERVELRTVDQDSGCVSTGSPAERDGCEELVHGDVSRMSFFEKNIENMAKDELQKQLVEQVELREKLERQFQTLKDNLQDQMKRELSCREEMVQQLQIVRDTLCSELDQERKARRAVQQKLKEAHDALHRFSCRMLTPRHSAGACHFRPPLTPP